MVEGCLATTVAGVVLLMSTRAPAAELHQAVRNQDVAAVEALLTTAGPDDVNARLKNDITALHMAAALDSDGMAALLLSYGAEIDARTSGGFTPLHWAAGRDADGAAAILIAMGADLNAHTMNGITPLHWAAGRNSTNTVKLLIAAGADVRATTAVGLTPLHWAMREEAEDSAVLLAFKAVSEEMEAEQAGKELAALHEEDLEPIEMPPERSSPPPPPPPQAARPLFDKLLAVPIGIGKELLFVWVEDLELWVGKYEVTNEEYRSFKPRHNSLFYEDFSLNERDQPVVHVSWRDARAFCDWLNENYPDRIPADYRFRLPKDREWITFTRCGDEREFPWGHSWPPAYGNYSDISARMNLPDWRGIGGYNDGAVVTCPVKDSGENEWGIFGLAGNVWEWCEDWYDEERTTKIRHGGSWDFDGESSLRVETRGFDRPDAAYNTIGFRLVVAPVKR